MNDKELKLAVISSLVSFVALGLIIGTFFIENPTTKLTITIVAFVIMVLQKILEIIFIKRTRKISIFVLILLVIAIIFFLTR